MLAIKAENISKQYRLGQVGTGTLSHDLNRFWHKIQGKEDPYLKIGEVNNKKTKSKSNYVWALQNINFEIEKGDTVGIIGKNGAGKSTLLKLLSKVTKPTQGRFKINGRIASLLEVGTGFHPQMTGRENIYLNGAILGMTRKEITRKLDEIIAFSEVGRYIDTPVKRYSSGMYVRLAFSVAAHLDAEILIIDEVLAVGDSEFQRKCLERIRKINQEEERTILFVSHNMHMLHQLCRKTILLENGMLVANGKTDDVIVNYLVNSREETIAKLNTIKIANTGITISDFGFLQHGKQTTYLQQGEGFECEFVVENADAKNHSLTFNIELKNRLGEAVTFFGNQFQNKKINLQAQEKKTIQILFSDLYLRKGDYFVNLFFSIDAAKWPDKSGSVQDAFILHIASPKDDYFINPNREWRDFSKYFKHGYLPMKMDRLEQKNFNYE